MLEQATAGREATKSSTLTKNTSPGSPAELLKILAQDDQHDDNRSVGQGNAAATMLKLVLSEEEERVWGGRVARAATMNHQRQDRDGGRHRGGNHHISGFGAALNLCEFKVRTLDT